MPKKNRKIIITGPTSFVGRTLIPLLAKYYKKESILCLVWNKDSPTGVSNRKTIEKLKLPIKKVDLVTKSRLSNLPKNPDIVIHMAANTDTSDPDHRVNDIGTKNLLSALGKLKPRVHFIYISTTVFLGGRKNCSKPLDESSKPYPTNEYSRTKLAAEKLLIKECKKQKFRLTILRLNTVYGPNPRPKSMFKLLPGQVKKGSIFLRLNWPGKTSLIHVDDVVKAILFFATKTKSRPGEPETYLVHSESPTFTEIVKQIHKALNIKYRPIKLPQSFWSLCKFARKLIPYFENILPQSLYNPFWRATLIVDNAVWCKTNKLLKIIPKWKPTLLKNCVKEVVNSSSD